MTQRKILVTVFLGLLSEVAWSQSFRRYVFQYDEKILFDYTNLMEKRSENFTRSENVWSGSFVIDDDINGRTNIGLTLKKTSGAGEGGNEKPNSFQQVFLSLSKNDSREPVARLCYSSYPGRDADVLIRNIVTSIQYFKYDQFLAERRTKEYFVDGQFDVAYDAFDGPKTTDDFEIEKQKTSVFNPAGNSLAKTIIDSFYCHLRYQRGDSAFSSLVLSEYKHQKLGDRVLAYIRSNITIIQEIDPADPLQSSGVSSIASFVCTDILNVLGRVERKTQIANNVLRNVSPAQLLNELRSDSIFSPSRQHELSSRLRAILFLQPAFFDEVKQVIDTCNPSGNRFLMIMNMLLGAESAQVQRFLSSYLNENANDYDRLKLVLPSMGVMTYLVDSSLLESITRLLNHNNADISSLAGLAFSNMSNQLKYNDSKSNQLLNRIMFDHYMQSPRGKWQKLQYLKEIGNSGDEDRIDFVAGCIDSKDDELTDAAISALRFVYRPEADSLLADLMLRDLPDNGVVDRVSDVIQLRFPTCIIRRGVYHLLNNQGTVKQIKKMLIDYLSRYSDELPALPAELASVKTSDKDLDPLLDDLRSRKNWYTKL